MKKLSASLVLASLAFTATASAQTDFGQLRSSVPRCTGVAGPAANQPATCAQWLALTACLTSAARAAGGVTIDGGVSTCGGLAGQAVQAADRAGQVCAEDARASNAQRAELSRIQGELAGVRRELTTCQAQLAARRSPTVTPPSPTRTVRLPICLPGPRNGNTELWCQTRSGQQLTGDDCREERRENIARAACQCPEGARAVAVGPEVDERGNRLPRGYVCAQVYRLEDGERVVSPPGASDANVGSQIAEINGRLNAVEARVTTVENGLGQVREGQRVIRDTVAVRLCGLQLGEVPTMDNCRPSTATRIGPAAAPVSSASHSLWLTYMPVLRFNGNVSQVGIGGYGVSLRLSEKVRLPIGIGAMLADTATNGVGMVYGYTAQLGVSFRLTQAIELGARAQFSHFLDFGAQDRRFEPIGSYRGIFAGGGIAARFGLGGGFVIDAALLFGAADSIALNSRTNRFEGVMSAAFVPTIGIAWQTF